MSTSQPNKVVDYPASIEVAGRTIKVSHRVAPREEARIVARIKVASACGIVVAGQYAPSGESLICYYESEAPEIEALVASDDQRAEWKRAGEAHERKMNAWLDSNVGPINDFNRNDPQYIAARQRSAQQYGGSSQAQMYFDSAGKGLPPIESLTVLGTTEAPATPERRDRNSLEHIVTKLGDVLAEAMVRASSGGGDSKRRGVVP